MGDYEKRHAAERNAQEQRDKTEAASRMAIWHAEVASWKIKTAFPPSTFIFTVTRGVPSMFAGTPNMEAGFNDPFDLWNYCKSTWGATSNLRNVWANGRMLISVEKLLRIFPDPTSFAEATHSVEP